MPLNIAFVSRWFVPRFGGIEIAEAELARELIRAGHHVVVHTGALHGEPKEAIADGVPVRRYRPVAPNLFLPDVAHADIVHLHGADRMLVATIPSRAKAAVITMHAGMANYAVARRPLLWAGKKAFDNVFGGALLSRFRSVLALNKAEGDYVARLGVPRHLISVVPNPVAPGAKTTVRAREQSVLFLGRLSPEKHVEEIIAACGMAAVDLKIAGSGDHAYEAELRKVAARVRINVRFLGYVDASTKSTLLKTSSALILASRREGQSLAVIEAMGEGCPVIIGASVMAYDGLERAAIFYEVGSVQSLAEAIATVVRGPIDRAVRDRVNCGYEIAKRHEPTHVAWLHEELYLSCI